MGELAGVSLATGECLLIPGMSLAVNVLESGGESFCCPASVYLLSRDGTLSGFLEQ